MSSDTSTPSGLAGFDVSHFQGTIDWPTVATAGLAYVFIKATEGIDLVDPQFASNWQGAHAAGLVRGAYHFFEPADDPTTQAEFFLKTVNLAVGDLPPVVDVEVTRGVSGSDLVAGLETWLEVVEQAVGVPPIVYTAPSFWDSLGSSQLGRYPLWVAEYGVSEPKLPAGWESWLWWQWSDAGTVAGVPAQTTDLDVFQGSLAELNARTLRGPALVPASS